MGWSSVTHVLILPSPKELIGPGTGTHTGTGLIVLHELIALHENDAQRIAHFLKQHPRDTPFKWKMPAVNSHVLDAALSFANLLIHRSS